MEAQTLAMAQEIDFSMWALFARATITVKLVMILLVGASIWAWSIVVEIHAISRGAQRGVGL